MKPKKIVTSDIQPFIDQFARLYRSHADERGRIPRTVKQELREALPKATKTVS